MSFTARFIVALIVLCLIVPVAAHASAPAAEGKKAGEAGLFDSNTVFYVRMEPVVLPVINDRGVSELVSMMVALEVKDQRTVERVNNLTPKLNDAYVRALYGRIDNSNYRNGAFIDVNKVKTQLVTITDQVLGKGIVENVLIQGVNQRRFN